jgi:hypothetical protein
LPGKLANPLARIALQTLQNGKVSRVQSEVTDLEILHELDRNFSY